MSVTGGFASGDTLGFVNQLGISGSFNAATGVLTLTGAAVPHDYEIALRAVTFSTSSGAAAGTRTFSFSLNDGAASSNVATKQISVQSNTLLAGDFTLDGHVNGADISAMLIALTDLNSYQSNHSLSAADLLAVGDVNHDGAVTNGDLQSLLSLLIGGGGSVASTTESTANSLGTPLGTFSGAATISASSKPEELFAPSNVTTVGSISHAAASAKLMLQTPLPWSDGSQTKRLASAAVDQTLVGVSVFRSRHLAWGPSKPGSNDVFASDSSDRWKKL